MSVAILRDGDVLDVSVTDDVNTTEAIDLRRYGAGIIIIPSGSSITEINWKVCATASGTYVGYFPKPVNADSYYAIDSNVLAAPYAKIVGDAAGTVTLCLKG